MVERGPPTEGPGGGPPAEGPGGGAARRGATAAAVGPGGREGRGGGGKPQKIIQSPNRQYKAPTDYRKPKNITQSPKKNIEIFRILDKTQKY